MFCTSTLLEGVNLPADNLFITDNKIFRSAISPVDFRSLIGRVGRISYNLYGNVFFVSEDKTAKPEEYIGMLKTPVPEQQLSIVTNPNVLKKVEKQYVAEILKSGESTIPRRVNVKVEDLQSEESYVMMRKFGLILLRDIMEDRDSLDSDALDIEIEKGYQDMRTGRVIPAKQAFENIRMSYRLDTCDAKL